MTNAVFPGQYNTAVPQMEPQKNGANCAPQQYQGGGNLSPEDINQIVAALKPTIESMIAGALPPVQDPEPEPVDMPQPGPGGPPDMAMPPQGAPQQGMPQEAPQQPQADEGNPFEQMMKRPSPMPQQFGGMKYHKESEVDQKEREELVELRGEVQRYARTIEDFESEWDEAKQRYSKALEIIEGQEEEIRTLRERDRYSRIQAKAHELSIPVDVEEEMEFASDLADDKFDAYLEKLASRAPVPVDAILPGVHQPQRNSKRGRTAADHYSKQAADEVAKRRRRGEPVEYKDVLNDLIESNPDNI